MPNHRYHIHIACVADDPLLQPAQDDIAIFFEGQAFLTKDLFINRPQSANYSWRCVNACDAMLLLIGGSYGKTNIAGVSQLHLSYSNAKTKNKPIFVFVHATLLNPFNENCRLQEFIKLIESQATESIWYFDDGTDWRSLLNETVGRLLTLTHSLGMTPKPSLPAHTMQTDDSSISNKATAKTRLDLDGEFLVSCTAHAFEGGNLVEVSFTLSMTWRQIITALLAFAAPFSDQRLSRVLTELMDKNQANQIVQTRHPKAHAVSRHQVSKADVLWIKDELQLAGWIVPTKQASFWQLADNARQCLSL